MTYATNRRKPAIDENRFSQDVYLHIRGSLEIDKALLRCFQFVGRVMPVYELVMSVYDHEIGCVRIVATADSQALASRSEIGNAKRFSANTRRKLGKTVSFWNPDLPRDRERERAVEGERCQMRHALDCLLEPQHDLGCAVRRHFVGKAQFSADLQHSGVARKQLPFDPLEPSATA